MKVIIFYLIKMRRIQKKYLSFFSFFYECCVVLPFYLFIYLFDSYYFHFYH